MSDLKCDGSILLATCDTFDDAKVVAIGFGCKKNPLPNPIRIGMMSGKMPDLRGLVSAPDR